MGIINKTYTFVGGTPKTNEALQVNSDFDSLYTLVNGNIDDANLSAVANIQQSKILNLVTALAAKFDKAGGQITGLVELFANFASVRFRALSVGVFQWLQQTETVGLVFYRNIGTDPAPNWSPEYNLAAGGVPLQPIDIAPKSYVDSINGLFAGGLGITKVTSSGGNFSTASVGFVQVTALTIAMTTRARRCQVSFIGNVQDGACFVTLRINGTNVAGANGLTIASATAPNASFTFITEALGAGLNNFEIAMRVDSGTATMRMNASENAFFVVQELPY